MTAQDLLLTATDAWHPVASETDLAYRHVFHGQLLGQELAIWRADDGHVNVWENRCLHRGVRLSIAQNDGRELKCQYHGWRYANRTAACTYIPAHPANAPARTITNRTFPVRVAHGLVWTSIGQPTEDPESPDGLVLRPLPVRATVEDAMQLLVADPPTAPDGASGVAHRCSDFSVEVQGVGLFIVQPTDAARVIIRGVLDPDLSPGSVRDRLDLLRHFDREISRLRDGAEAAAARNPAPEELAATYLPVPEDLVEVPDGDQRELPTRVRVARAWDTASGVRALELVSATGDALPSGQAGSHLDVALPGGQVRQYSLVNGPGETDHYLVGVKRTADSAGGSIAVHEHLREGDVLAVSLPRNCFPLRRDRHRTVLIAGGIGLTPLLAMAQALHHQQLGYELHYFVSSDEDVAFRERLEQLDNVRIVCGLSPAETEAELTRILTTALDDDSQAYFCGPPPMLELATAVARTTGWAKDAVHVEYFRNDIEIDDSSQFEVVLARSVMTLTVQPGKSILETLREAGVVVPSSCEQGACGTCRTTVIEGTPDHQDVYLDDDEKAACDSIMTCVSRSLTPQLTLDL
ncbi:Rieske 2Fe-2S domain-containing protein [Flexivirga sp. B27]